MKEKTATRCSWRSMPFLIILVLILVMGSATFIEKEHGPAYVYFHVYGSWWFASLWFILVVFSVIGIIKGKMYRNIPLLLVHLSFIIILAGALFTKLFAKQGVVIINKEIVCDTMQSNHTKVSLPFELVLDTFYISYYAGTNAPSDYVSRFSIKDKLSNKMEVGVVSMNQIFSRDGYRFYQSSFNEDHNSSVLNINHDPLGIGFTYTGYALFMLSMIWYLLSPNNPFRKLLKSPILKKTFLLLLLILPATSFSQVMTNDGLSIQKTQSTQFGNLWILYEGKISPITTFATDFTLKITGKTSFGYLDANQFLIGFLFFPNQWKQVALFEIKDPSLKKELNAEQQKAALADFYDAEGTYRLQKYWKELSTKSPKSALLKEVEKLDEKIQLINMLHAGNLLQIYPQVIHGQIKWFYPTQNLRTAEEQQNRELIRNSLLSYYQAVTSNDVQKCDSTLKVISDFQKQNAALVLPSDTHRAIEIFYLKTNFTSLLFKINLTLGFLSLLAVFSRAKRHSKKINSAFWGILTLCFLAHSISIGLRTYIGGRLPFSNGFETMLLIAWCAMLIPLCWGRKRNILVSFGYVISGCSLLVAHLSMMNPKITPLVPVLSSPLLSIHVSVIMIAYTLLGFIMLNSVCALIELLFCSKKGQETILIRLEQHKIHTLICLYPSLLFLGSGIFIGAVWANISWGRYWGWDPKEVWALITFLMYSLMIPQKRGSLFNDLFFFHAFGLVCFSVVLMTYFGVNYFLGGMHSYAGEIEFSSALCLLAAISLVVICLLIGSFSKYKSIKKALY